MLAWDALTKRPPVRHAIVNPTPILVEGRRLSQRWSREMWIPPSPLSSYLTALFWEKAGQPSCPREDLLPCCPHAGQLGRLGERGPAGGSHQDPLQWQREWGSLSLGSTIPCPKPVAPIPSWKRQRIKHRPRNWAGWMLLYVTVMNIQPVSKPKPDQNHPTPRNLSRAFLPRFPHPRPGAPTGFSPSLPCRRPPTWPAYLLLSSFLKPVSAPGLLPSGTALPTQPHSS